MENKMSPWILEKILQGKAILFLGAGASYGAITENGKKVLNANGLRDLLCERFLGGEQKDKPLVKVADYAKYQAGLPEVQICIKDEFKSLQPSDFHKLIPTFKWHAIFTTNYDFIVERAYDQVPEKLQELATILRDGDSFSEAISNPNSVPFFKLHGCLSCITDPGLPLILGSEEYAKYKKNRVRLFGHLAEFGKEHPIIFCGYQVNDPNIQHILFDLFDAGINRPPYMVVDPGINQYDIQMWNANRIETRKETFHDFINYINSQIHPSKRILGTCVVKSTDPIFRYLKPDISLSENLANYLKNELEHIVRGMATIGAKPNEFYSGLDNGWGAISEGLDIVRRLADQILIDSVIEDRLDGAHSFLIKGHAGSGKSVMLKRIAWNAAKDFEIPVIMLRSGAILRPSLIKELALSCDCRLLLLVDDATKNEKELEKLFEILRNESIQISVITTARSNEWNQSAADLDRFISSEYEINPLTDQEIDELVNKLQHHHCLGNFKNSSTQDIRKAFDLSSDRQLLVALHEVTSGRPFEEIVFDEYQRVVPKEAQLLYMDVCTLNRMNVPVRAGLISRISGISIEDFKRRFISPLEHVVKVYMDHRSRDYVYEARHPLIASFVFDQANSNPEDKAAQIVRVIQHMNLDYSADEYAFSSLIKGKTLASIFGDKALAKKVYDAAEQIGASASFIWHQKAIFELNHSGCDLRAAMSAILTAEKYIEEGRSDKAILHTKAIIYKKMANTSQLPLEIEKYRLESRLILERLVKFKNDSRAFHGLVELDLDDLADRLKMLSENAAVTDLEERALVNIIKKTEDAIYKGIQMFPGDEFLILARVKLAKLLKEHEKVGPILEKALSANLSSEYIAVNLARHKESEKDFTGAADILRRSIAENPNSKPLHLNLAKILIRKNDEVMNIEIMHHLKRSFSPGDSNYDAQFWYARQNYLFGDRRQAIKDFAGLKNTRMPPFQRSLIQGYSLKAIGEYYAYRGQIISEHVTFCFIKCSELGDEVFSHISKFDDQIKDKLSVGAEVSFNLGFSMKGPEAVNVKIL